MIIGLSLPLLPVVVHASVAPQESEEGLSPDIAYLAIDDSSEKTQEILASTAATDKEKDSAVRQTRVLANGLKQRFPRSSKIQDAAARSALRLGDNKTAMADANRAISLAANQRDIPQMMAALRTRALIHYNNGNFPKAYNDSFKVIKKYPKDKVAYAIVMLTKGRGARVDRPLPKTDVKEIRDLLSRSSPLRDPRVRKILADNADKLKASKILSSSARKLSLLDPNDTLVSARKAFHLDPGNPDANMQMGLAFLGLKMYDQAIQAATSTLEAGKRKKKGTNWMASAYGIRSMAYLEINAYLEAQADSEATLLLQPDNASAHLTLARTQEKLSGLSQEVIDRYKLAAEYAPDLFSDQYQAALARFQQMNAPKTAAPAEETGDEDSTGLGLRLGGLATLIILGAGFFSLRKKQEKILKAAAAAAAKNDISSRYTLGATIGAGGMGTVYSAQDRELGRKVAVKELRPELQALPKERDRFISEARIVAALKEHHIVEIYDIVKDKDKTYLIFEYVEGDTLDKRLQKSPGKKLALPEATKIIDQVCMGLSHAHSQNVIHRDLKPSNIMIENNGLVRVMDFGIARQAKDALANTSTGSAVGTGYYMAPEQTYGKSSRTSDLYSLAVTFYEMITGQRPFSGGTIQNDKLDGTFTMPSAMGTLPKGLDSFFVKALDPRPEKRFQNTREFMGALDIATAQN